MLSEVGQACSDPGGVGKQRKGPFLPSSCPIKPSPRLRAGLRVPGQGWSPRPKDAEPLGTGPHGGQRRSGGPSVSLKLLKRRSPPLGHSEPSRQLSTGTPGLTPKGAASQGPRPPGVAACGISFSLTATLTSQPSKERGSLSSCLHTTP